MVQHCLNKLSVWMSKLLQLCLRDEGSPANSVHSGSQTCQSLSETVGGGGLWPHEYHLIMKRRMLADIPCLLSFMAKWWRSISRPLAAVAHLHEHTGSAKSYLTGAAADIQRPNDCETCCHMLGSWMLPYRSKERFLSMKNCSSLDCLCSYHLKVGSWGSNSSKP